MLLAVPSMASAQTAGGQTNLSRAAIHAISANMRAGQKLQRRNYQAGAEGGAAGGGGLSTGAIAGIALGVAGLAGGIAAATSGGGSNSP
jgi:hypothetical protein